MSSFNRLTARAKDILAGFTTGQKAITALAVVALLFGGMMFYKWASKPDYQPLFSNLAATDAASITSKLTAAKVPYQLGDGGGTILVPSKDVYQQRLTMSAAGLPTGGASGYSLLDKQGITTSEFQQNVTFQRAMEGELEKTIESMDGVDAAVVHLVIPQQDLFSEDTRKPSASVLVKTSPTAPLSSDQVQAIVHLVSSSVEGLTPDQVTLADASGHLLSAPGADGTVAAAGNAQAEQTAAYENQTADKIQQMLDSVVGAGHAVVRVNADLNFDQQDTTSEQYVANKNTPPLSQSSTKETYSGAGTPTGGPLGTGTTPVPTTSGGNNTYSKTDTSQDNAVGKVTTQTKSAVGTVKRQSVAVLLDNRVAGTLDVNRISGLVSTAAGAQTTRGDTVTVDRLPFDTSAAKAASKELAAAASTKKMSQMLSLAKTLLILLFIAALLFFAIRSSRKHARGAPLVSAEKEELDDARRLISALQARELELRQQREIAAPTSVPNLDAGEQRRTAIRDEIGELVERQPEEVAQLLRGWLADRRN